MRRFAPRAFEHCIGSAIYSSANDNLEYQFSINENNGAILITSDSGLQFFKKNYSDGTAGIVYDCSVGTKEEGDIYVQDSMHPPQMKFLTIENCYNITLHFSKDDFDNYRNSYNFNEYYSSTENTLKMIRVRNVHFLTVGRKNYIVYKNKFNIFFKNIELADIKILKIYNLKFFSPFNMTTLRIENATIDDLPDNAIGSNVNHLYLKDVKIKTIKSDAISLAQYWNSTLTVRDSSFGRVDENAFSLRGSKVEIHNNTFQNLENRAFSITASKFFNFSENYVKELESPFDVNSPRIEIVSNTFHLSKRPWLSGFHSTIEEYSAINFSKNNLDHLPSGFFFLDLETIPDEIKFENNNFKCSCKYLRTTETTIDTDKPKTMSHKLSLIRLSHNNLCINFNNCSLSTVMERIIDVCMNKFDCSEKPKETFETYLKSILSTLNNISQKMDWLKEKNKSSVITENSFEQEESETSVTPI